MKRPFVIDHRGQGDKGELLSACSTYAAMTGRYAMGLAHNSMQVYARTDLNFDVLPPGGLGVIMVAETMGNHMEVPAEGRKKHVDNRTTLAMFRRGGCTAMFVNGWRFHTACLR